VALQDSTALEFELMVLVLPLGFVTMLALTVADSHFLEFLGFLAIEPTRSYPELVASESTTPQEYQFLIVRQFT
jgi:hypothetical protein